MNLKWVNKELLQNLRGFPSYYRAIIDCGLITRMYARSVKSFWSVLKPNKQDLETNAIHILSEKSFIRFSNKQT
jgi:hypothetical protein